MDAGAWLQKLAELWRREHEASRERFALLRRDVPLAERVERGFAARDLSVVETDAAAGGRVTAWLEPRRAGELELLRAGAGDPVRLWRDKPDGEGAIVAVLAKRKPGRIAVVIEADDLEALDAGAMHLDRDEPTATFDRGARAIGRMRDAKAGTDEARLRDVLFGEKPPRYAKPPEVTWRDRELNEPQRVAVTHALAAQDIALIHGPPGTGKTRTLVEVIRQKVALGEKLLVTAASNAAVDNVTAQLVAEGVECVRLGHPARVSPVVEDRTLDALLEASGDFALARKWHTEAVDRKRRARMRLERGQIRHHELRDEMREANALHRDARKQLAGAQEAIIARMPVVCATAAGTDVALLGDAVFDTVILDEATQAPDPIAMVALLRGRRAVLAGDPCQLPPTVIDPVVAREGLGTTFFERLAQSAPDAVRMLVVQHRMNEALMAFPSASMYRGKLVAAAHVAAQRLEDLGLPADPARPGAWHFIDTSGRGWTEERASDDPSTRNPGEAERVAVEARRLLARGLAAADLAVITPYDAQVRLLKELLAAEVAAGLEIGSVDGFQGREKEAILVDLVRSNDDGDIGFLADRRRMNVALTRAKRFLLVIGDGATLGGDEYFAALLKHAQETGAWLSAWEDQ